MTFTSSKITSLTQVLAIGTLAIGASVGIAAAPAQAVLLSNGAVTFTGSTTDFFTNASNSTFGVTFSNEIPPTVDVQSLSGPDYVSDFTNTGVKQLSFSPTATFNQVGSSNTYLLASDLIFNFANTAGSSVKAGAGSAFLRTFNGTSVSFVSSGSIGTTFSNVFGAVNTDSFSLIFNDISTRSGAGGYSLQASTFTAQQPPSTSVPEPFTIVGTIIGASAAMRMRKKLSDSN
jgi:hypothetical protein